MKSTRKLQAMLAMGAVALYMFGGSVSPASAAVTDTLTGKASAFAIKADLLGTNVIPETPLVSTDGVGPDTNNTIINIPADPLLVNGTLIAESAVHKTADLTSELNQSKQDLAGPYNARSVGQIEDLNLLINGSVPGGVLVHAGLIRSEAVAVCGAPTAGSPNGTPTYSANSEVVDLQIGGQDPFSGPLNDALKQITEGLAPLADLVSVNLNVVSPDKTSVDAVVITLLQAAAANGAPGPLAQIHLGHADISGMGCGTADVAAKPQCSDGIDNDGDHLIDIADPGCHVGEVLTGAYLPDKNSEENTSVLGNDVLPALPKTGTAIPTGVAAGLGLGALSLLALRRRLAAV